MSEQDKQKESEIGENGINIEIKNSKKDDMAEAESLPGSGGTTNNSAESEAHTSDIDSSEVKPALKATAEYELKMKELEDRYLRLAAEFDNYKKRSIRQYEEIVRNSNINLVTQILEVIDNFERALESFAAQADIQALYTGAKLIHQQLMDMLSKEGLEPITAVGEPFDPNLHEAVMQVASDEFPEGAVAMEMIRGYKMNGKVVRYARVAVSRGKDLDSDKGNNDSHK